MQKDFQIQISRISNLVLGIFQTYTQTRTDGWLNGWFSISIISLLIICLGKFNDISQQKG